MKGIIAEGPAGQTQQRAERWQADEEKPPAAVSWFRKAMPQNPRPARRNISIAQGY